MSGFSDSQFRTPVPVPAVNGLVSYESPMLTIGSCFADTVGSRLASRLFRITVNPFGPVFNPVSVARTVDYIVSGKGPDPAEFFEHQGLWRHFGFHSRMAAASAELACERIGSTIRSVRSLLLSGPIPPVVFLTLGTSFVFDLASRPDITVSNCHKLPADRFIRHALDIPQVVDALAGTVRSLRSLVPHTTIMLTVSPVRHLADGAHGNQLSKAVLLLACRQVCTAFDDVHYFPAYEIMLDDLRDYRFYAGDMVHPSDLAADYLFNCFAEAYFTDDTCLTAAGALKITTRTAHRFSDPASPEAVSFAHTTRQLHNQLAAACPYISPLMQ